MHPTRQRYGTSSRAGTTFSPEELAERGVKKVVIYAQRETWEGIDALVGTIGDSRSAVVAALVAEALARRKPEKAAAKKK